MTVVRSNYITGVLYPEHYNNSFSDMISEIESLRVSYCVSPLHDLDRLKNGKGEKPHYHVILSFTSLKSMKQANEFMSKINGVVPELVFDIGGMTRYLTHYGVKDERKTLYYKFSEFGEPFVDLVTYGLAFPYTDYFYRQGSAQDYPSRALQIIYNNECKTYYDFLNIVMLQKEYKAMLSWVSRNKFFVSDMIFLYNQNKNFNNANSVSVDQLVDSRFSKELDLHDIKYLQQNNLFDERVPF